VQAGTRGIVGKRIDSGYVSRRSPNWIKIKCTLRQEFVVVGYTDPKGSRNGIGALLLGIHDDDGKLRYAGKVGTGFDTATLDELRALLEPLAIERTALVDKPAEARGHWVTPKVVVEVSFGEWTKDGIIRIRCSTACGPTSRRARSRASARPRQAGGQRAPQRRRRSDEHRESCTFTAKAGDRAGAHVAERVGAKAADRAGAKAADRQGAKAADRTAAKAAPAKKSSKAPSSAPQRAPHPALADMRITHPERVIDSSTGLTKLDLIEYYARARAHILPHLKQRPVSLVRAPSGIGEAAVLPEAQRHAEDSRPERARPVDRSGSSAVHRGPERHCAARRRADERHRVPHVEFDHAQPAEAGPDAVRPRPGEGIEFDAMREAAHCAHVLDELGLESFLKTSGGKGLHVVVPLTRATTTTR
jgi:bifunctional non-homologous end joining protein LigD